MWEPLPKSLRETLYYSDSRGRSFRVAVRKRNHMFTMILDAERQCINLHRNAFDAHWASPAIVDPCDRLGDLLSRASHAATCQTN